MSEVTVFLFLWGRGVGGGYVVEILPQKSILTAIYYVKTVIPEVIKSVCQLH